MQKSWLYPCMLRINQQAMCLYRPLGAKPGDYGVLHYIKQLAFSVVSESPVVTTVCVFYSRAPTKQQ